MFLSLFVVWGVNIDVMVPLPGMAIINDAYFLAYFLTASLHGTSSRRSELPMALEVILR